MTESIEVVLNHMAEKEGCDISFERRLVDGLQLLTLVFRVRCIPV